MPKLCPKCNRILDESKFNWKIKGVRLAVHCRDCSKKYIKEHYYKNKKYYLAKAKISNIKYKKKIYGYVGEFLKTHPCVDCGETDIIVLEFDHIDRKTKTGEVARILSNSMSLKKVKTEIEKCEVRCANCHRRKTAIESNSWRYNLHP